VDDDGEHSGPRDHGPARRPGGACGPCRLRLELAGVQAPARACRRRPAWARARARRRPGGRLPLAGVCSARVQGPGPSSRSCSPTSRPRLVLAGVYRQCRLQLGDQVGRVSHQCLVLARVRGARRRRARGPRDHGPARARRRPGPGLCLPGVCSAQLPTSMVRA
jgi:hypothetical protein